MRTSWAVSPQALYHVLSRSFVLTLGHPPVSGFADNFVNFRCEPARHHYTPTAPVMAGSTTSNDALRTLMLRLLFRRLTAEPALAPAPVSSEPNGQVRQATAEERQAGAICRVCFEAGSGVLITPCACTGTQQLIHEHCLRQWQRSLLGQRDAGQRASRCSVCTHDSSSHCRRRHCPPHPCKWARSSSPRLCLEALVAAASRRRSQGGRALVRGGGVRKVSDTSTVFCDQSLDNLILDLGNFGH